MSDIFFRWNYANENSHAGWYYKYKNKVSGPHDTKKQAEDSLMVILLDTKPQLGRYDYNNR